MVKTPLDSNEAYEALRLHSENQAAEIRRLESDRKRLNDLIDNIRALIQEELDL